MSTFISSSKLFENFRHSLTLSINADEQKIVKQLLVNNTFSLGMLYYNENDLHKNFTNFHKLVGSKKFLKGVTKIEQQQTPLKHHHKSKVGHRGIHQVKNTLKNYCWSSMEWMPIYDSMSTTA